MPCEGGVDPSDRDTARDMLADLPGWELSDDGDAARKVREAEQRVAGSVEDALAPSREEKPRRSRDKTSVHVFLETGRKLKITQTNDGLFVSFDRSVVEERVQVLSCVDLKFVDVCFHFSLGFYSKIPD